MEDQRKARAIGSELVLGGICYRLDGVEGCGSSAIVYRATYTDSLNRDSLHQVLIKELFPFSAWGGIDRDQNGDIVCTDAARDIMLEAQRRFRMGNQVNLDLLRRTAPIIPCCRYTAVRTCCKGWKHGRISLCGNPPGSSANCCTLWNVFTGTVCCIWTSAPTIFCCCRNRCC